MSTDAKPLGLGSKASMLGQIEWKEIEAAVLFASAAGAKDILLFGWSQGSLICSQFLINSKETHLIRGAIFDSPLLDYRTTMRFQAQRGGYEIVLGDAVVDAIKNAITPKTKAIVPVHLFGRAANMEAIMRIAKEHNLYVIEDNAQAIGSDYHLDNGAVVKTGTIGHIGCTSFFPSKNLGCYGDGGAMCTNDDTLAEKIRMIANHGQSKRYYHDVVGCNSRLDSIQAAVLRIKLRQLDNYIDARRNVADYYDGVLGSIKGVSIPFRAHDSKHVFHQYTIKLEGIDRNGLNEYLASKDIPSMIYYPVPLHLQKAYLNPRYKSGDFPITENLCATVISLPMHTEMQDDQLSFIISSVLEFLSSN
jgi:dTDP-4-amino-4,6-dideoxygalactose transaminase